ncbi:MAG TPA: DUF445 domain-containing protein [Nocardioides sp.]|uniref:DUF445 domain-containing protein n=1 Tax=Nocardioides sp. TaxID=35761 RepID=UPI002D7EBBC1|nr:DUF445 domain-containing protein [Nocardioides sp.]HET6652766.1 DUF445 domain-containing protein [Nocardioides sp.]
MSVPLITAAPELDEERRRGLRRMRSLAVGLLLFAAVVYLATLDEDGFLGFVNAGAEASMVGAIADWFAVTALFKHPLGLPIPHTALIPRRKEMLGRSLEEFVGENFLHEQVIRERMQVAELSRRVGDWLVVEEHARRVVDEAASVLHIGLTRVRDEDIAVLVEEALLPRLRAEPISPVAGSLLAEVVRDKAHHGLVDLALDEAYRWLDQNEDTFSDIVGERAPWWSPPAVNDRVTRRIHVELLAWISDIRNDPVHHARIALDSVLAQLAEDLLHDPATQARAEALKERVFDHPQILVTAISLWKAFRVALLHALADDDGPLLRRAVAELTAFGQRLLDDAELRAKLDQYAADFAVFVVDRYGAELTTVITHTIDRWDGKEAARKIELHVGRDLQFIRINGTIVGGLVGVLIHTVAVLT